MFVQIVENTVVTTALFSCLIAAYSLLSSKGSRIQPIDVILMVAFVFATGIRLDVGADFVDYQSMYENLLAKDGYLEFLIGLYGFDSGFWILCYLFGKTPFGASCYGVFWLSSCLIYPLTILYLRKKTDSAPLALAVFLFLGFFGMSLNVLRHATAAVFVLWAFEMLHPRRWWSWFLFVALISVACVFHMSALVAGSIIVLARWIRPSRKLLALAFAIGFALFLAWPVVLRFIVGCVPLFARFSTTLDYMDGSLSREYQWIATLFYIVLYTILVICLTDRKAIILDLRLSHMTSCIILALPVSIVALSVWPLNRVAVFLFQFSVALIPFYLDATRDRYRYAAYLAVPGMMLWHIPYCLFSWNVVTPFVTYL